MNLFLGAGYVGWGGMYGGWGGIRMGKVDEEKFITHA